MYHYHYTFYLSIILILIASTTNAYIIPQQELQSMNWLIKQYGQSLLPLDQTICNGTFFSNIRCSVDDNDPNISHIESIAFYDSFTDIGFPDATLNQLVFPKMVSFFISSTKVKNQTMTVLSLLKNLPLLQTIILSNDLSVTQVPIDFPNNIPMLHTIGFHNATNLISIPTFFNNTYATYIILGSNPNLQYLGIDSSLNLPYVNSIPQFTLYPTSYYTINVATKSFPQLEEFSMVLKGPSSIDVILNSTALTIVRLNMTSAPINLTIESSMNIEQLSLAGGFLFRSDIKDFSSLYTLYLVDTTIQTMPFTAYPPSLQILHIENSSIPTMENIPIQTNLTTFIMRNGILSGSLPLGIFENAQPGIFTLDLSNNPDFEIGDVPTDWCYFKFVNLSNTIVNSVPDCFYCYPDTPFVSIPLSPPTSFQCPITISNYDLISINSKITVLGSNIGYGYPNGSPIVPNKMVEFNIGPYIGGPERQVQQALTLGNYYYTFNVLEVGIVPNFATVNLQSGGTNHELVVSFSNLNDYLTHSITLNNGINCLVTQQTNQSITCLFPKSTQISPSFKFNVSNPYYSIQMTQSFYYYPTVTAVYYYNTTRALVLYGQYGTELNPVVVKVSNNTINCVIFSISSYVINCTLVSVPPPGPSTLYVSLNQAEFMSSTLLNFGYPSGNNNNGSTTTGATTTVVSTGGGTGETPKEQCERLTFNCYGHGYCDDNGICQCDEYYNPVDNCLTKYINTNITPNETNPTVGFNIDGISFYFEIYSIQELNYDGSVLQEVLLLNDSITWNVTLMTLYDNATTLANYTLNTLNVTGRDGSGNQLPTSFQDVIVYSEVSFSPRQRNITFGDRVLELSPNSIKVSFTIKQFPYSSNMATLRVVFKSIINNEQFIEYDCEKQSIDTFTTNNDQFSSSSGSIEYLRVIKDNIQFNGRFIDYVLSDGRSTYSKTELISLTPITSNDTNEGGESIALIGINLPQCSLCQLDPDFTPLLVDNKDNDCDSSTSNNWRIIVGVVVGGVVAIALAIGAAIFLKKRFRYANDNQKLSKLSSFNN